MKDLTIVLACSAGMSTSLLVKKMEAAAEEKGVTCKIHAIPIAAIDETVAKEKIDVLL